MAYSGNKTSTHTEPSDMAQLLQEAEPIKEIRRGDIVGGEVVRVDEEGILVYIGHKADGIVPLREMRTLSAEALGEIRPGDEIYTLVVRPDSEEGSAILSIDKARLEHGWASLQRQLDNGETTEAVITGYNKGGAVAEVGGVQGFIPLSQLAPLDRSAGTQEEALSLRVGETVNARLLEVNRRRNRVILSERQAIHESKEAEKNRLLEELEEGAIRRGVVSGISSFGIFVDLGGADGLIHISELSWGQVGSPEDVAKPGDEIDVYILRVDKGSRKIALSLRRLESEPWSTVAERYEVGQVVDATVTKLTSFGAFARIEDTIEGLIHISELSDHMVQHPKEVVNTGDDLRLRIIRIEPERRRLGLSLKQAQDPWDVVE